MAYTPGSYLCILAPPDPPLASESDYETYYAPYQDQVSVIVADDCAGVDIAIQNVEPEADDSLIRLHTPTGGTLRFYPASGVRTLPNNGVLSGDTVLVQVFKSDFRRIQRVFGAIGLPTPAWWVIEGIDETTFLEQLTLWAAGRTEAEKAKVSTLFPPTDTSIDTTQNFVNQVLAGNWGVGLFSNAYIGRMTEQSSGTYGARLRAFDAGGHEVDVAPLLAALPDVNFELYNHPVAVDASEIEVDTTIHIQFRYWDVGATSGAGKGDWAAVAAGASIHVVESSSGTVIDTQPAGSSGEVTFSFPAPGLRGRGFHFEVAVTSPITRQYGRSPTWTGTWSTLGWKANDGSAGSYEDFRGSMIGRSDAPALFNIGTPVFLSVAFLHKTKSAWWPAARGTYINVYRLLEVADIPSVVWSTVTEATLAAFTTSSFGEFAQWTLSEIVDYEYVPLTYFLAETFFADEDGEVWGTAFDLRAESMVDVVLPFSIEDDSISLPKVTTVYPLPWYSSDNPTDGFYDANFVDAAIGDPAQLRTINLDSGADEISAAGLYVLKRIRDTHQWFHLLSGGEWSGVTGLWVILQDLAKNPLVNAAGLASNFTASVAPPDAVVLERTGIVYSVNNWWSTANTCHEYAHTVMWRYVDYTTIGLALDIRDGHYVPEHNWNIVSSEQTALMDGWSLILELAFGRNLPWTDADGDGVPENTVPDINKLGAWVSIASNPGIGLTCEGAFAQAVWNYLNAVVGIEATEDRSDAPYLSSVNRTLSEATCIDGFRAMIWTPLKDLEDSSYWTDGTHVTVADFIARMEANMSASDWTVFEAGYLEPWGLIAP